MAWLRGEDSIDAEAGAFVFAEFVLLSRAKILAQAEAGKRKR